MFFRRLRQAGTSTRSSNFPPPYMSSTGTPPAVVYPPSVQPSPAASGLQPFLGLRARSSLAWLAYPILILFLMLIQLLLSLQSVHDGVGDAKRQLVSGCTGLEGAASVAVSIPHFMAAQTNEMIASGAENIVRGLATVLDLSIRAIEAIILYIIDTYRSLYLCLAEFVVRGSLALLLAAAQEAEKIFSEAVAGVGNAIESAIGGAESLLTGAINDLNKIPTVHIKPPQLGKPDLTVLQNVKLPTGFTDALSHLNSSLPTLSELKDSMDKIVTVPFESLRVEITTHLQNASIDRNLLSVPPQKTLRFCQNVDTSFVDEIGKIITAGIKFIMLGIVVAMILMALFNILKERFLYKRMLIHVERSREAWLKNNMNSLSTPKLLTFLQSVHNPLASRVTVRLRNRGRSGNHRVPWLMAYLTWPAALLFLGAGLLGLLVVETQIYALHGVRNRAVDQANSGVTGITNVLSDKINAETANSSAAFARDTNSVILRFQTDVNDHMLGWAGTTTTTLNNTLVSFYDGLTSVVNGTFGNTPLRDPALELLNCLVGSKVAGIEKALTFVHDHAHVDLPTVSPTALMLSPRQTEDLVRTINPPQTNDANPQDAAQDQTAATGFVDRIIDRYVRALKKQRITYFALLACYLVVIIFGIIGILWDTFHRQKTRPSGSAGEIVAEKLAEQGSPEPGLGLPPTTHKDMMQRPEPHGNLSNPLYLCAPLDPLHSPHLDDSQSPRNRSLDSLINARIVRDVANGIGSTPSTRMTFPSSNKFAYPTSLLTAGYSHPYSLSSLPDPPLPPLNFTGPHLAPSLPPSEFLLPEEPVSKFSPITPTPSPGSKWAVGGRNRNRNS